MTHASRLIGYIDVFLFTLAIGLGANAGQVWIKQPAACQKYFE